MNRPSPSRLLVAALLAAAGCGTAENSYTCNPACSADSHCEASGCVPNHAGDLLSAAADADTGCSPACSGATPYCNAGHVCVPCLKDADCKPGNVCKVLGNTSACVPGCSDDARCAGSGMGDRCCGSQCVDSTKDASNCGACGTTCSAPHAKSSCVAGACQLGGCSAGWGDCNADPKDGCEVSFDSDAANCGACGMACKIPNAIAGCAHDCYIRACNYGWDDCNGDPKDGCEMNVLANNANCGACGKACPVVAHGKNSCVNGGCQITSCDAGYLDCDGMPGNGCEVNAASDAANCGGCGIKCAQGLICSQSICTCPQCNLPNAKSTCVNLQCAVASCNAGYGDCDGQPQNGCETPLGSDVRNCGQCGNACAQGLVCTNGGCTCPQCNFPNASSKCVNNVCQLDKCTPLWGNCNNNAADGCEKDLSADAKNCGACGMACPNNLPNCVNGVCQAQPACGGWDNGAGCWYTTALGQSCSAFCQQHGGFDAAHTQHSGNSICFHFYPMKANGNNWMSVECCSTDNNTNWGATGAAPDPNFSHAACYLACACAN